MIKDALYHSLKQRINEGEWPAGQRMPSIRKLASEATFTYHTIVSAYTRLVSEGILSASPGKGYFVTCRVGKAANSREPVCMEGDPLFRLLQSGPQYTKLGCGWLPPAWRDTQLLAKAIRRTARLEQSSLAEYGDISGYLPMRRQLCVHIKRLTRVDLRPNQILTTLGATQGLDLVTRLLIKPGDHVFVDEPGNGNLIRLIQLAGGTVIGIRRTQDGPDINEMESHLARHRIKVFFCNSTFHNPTGGNISPHNAFKVLRLAVQHDFIVVEDDVYGDFSPSVRQTFAELDNMERVIYIGSFSKCLSASLRVGFIACSQELIEPLTRLKLLTCVAVPAFCDRFVNTILTDGTYARHMKDVQQRLIKQQVQTQQSLLERGWQFDIKPQGGMFIWANHPELPCLQPLINKLEKQKILLMPGSAFSVTRDFQSYLRINCTHFSEKNGHFFSV